MAATVGEALRWDLGIAFAVLGLGAWITVNGVYQELPYIAQRAPEGYDIFSWMVVALAASNLAPLLYMALRRRSDLKALAEADPLNLALQRQWWDLFDSFAILAGVGFVGTSVFLALALAWHATATLGVSRSEISVGLLACVFVGGGVDALTSVLFYPLAAKFPKGCTACLLAGEALSGLFAAILASIQVRPPLQR